MSQNDTAPASLLEQAWENEDFSLRDDLFQNTWLPRYLPPAEMAALADKHVSLLKELYPDIYRYGSEYDRYLASLPRLQDIITTELAQNVQPLLTVLAELDAAFSHAYNTDETFAELENNAEYVYLNNGSTTADEDYIPGYSQLGHTPGLKQWVTAWSQKHPQQENVINEFIIIAVYKDFYLTLPVFKTLPGFADMAEKFQRLLDTYNL